jgi:excisionase family DNA binding protein
MANIVTAKELGDYLKLSDSTVYKLAMNRELPGFKIGRSWRFDMDEVNAHIRAKKGAVGFGETLTKKIKKTRRRR